MPNYVKFLKDILSKKRRLGEFETVALTQECTSILKSELPKKLRDPGSFTIPCTIGEKFCGKALCDLGASINLMPLSVFKKLGIGEARPTTVTLQLADRSFTHPEGKIEDVLVRVDKFIFPADFIILDYEADKDVPIILGRPFLATGRTLIDVQKGELTMRVDDQEVTFNVFNATRYPDQVEECSAISTMDTILADKMNQTSQLGVEALNPQELADENEDNEELVTWVETGSSKWRNGLGFEQLDLSEKKLNSTQPSIEEPPTIEMKQCPSQVKYAFLGKEESLPVIISSSLSKEHEKAPIQLWKERKKEIGWTMGNIKEISPANCMHKVLREDYCSSFVQHQRQLNPVMNKGVKHEIIKWLDAGVIHPISDSSWHDKKIQQRVIEEGQQGQKVKRNLGAEVERHKTSVTLKDP